MAKEGKLTKLKSVLKKWHSMGKLRTQSSSAKSPTTATPPNDSEDSYSSYAYTSDKVSPDLHPVYVGKSRRRYLISSEVVGHPLFQELVERSGDSDAITVGCEVVLFEHMLWMLENADPQSQPEESLDDLVQYYAC
ncbi:Small auxin-up RNA [Dillenia turbinata]|uniref:Small auxin-up RNA n=1 Tax=Dillenia turbinata TaxID=194707 RepID=A0AAN8WEY6_9MAGN